MSISRRSQVLSTALLLALCALLVAATADARELYAGNSDSDDVTVLDTNSSSTIDVGTRAVVGAPIPVGLGPIGIAVTPDGTRAYVANSDDSTVSVVDL